MSEQKRDKDEDGMLFHPLFIQGGFVWQGELR